MSPTFDTERLSERLTAAVKQLRRLGEDFGMLGANLVTLNRAIETLQDAAKLLPELQESLETEVHCCNVALNKVAQLRHELKQLKETS